jgi:hypothetical protein
MTILFHMRTGATGVNLLELNKWLQDPHVIKLSEHYKALACRYATTHAHRTEQPIGRGLAKFMLMFNERHPNMNWFPQEMINYWYYY